VARNLTPPVGLTVHDAEVDGTPIIVADVPECPFGQKPCHVTSTGKAYGRSFDGNFDQSDLERQAFLVGRTYPRSDHDAVPGSSAADLDPELLADWISTVRERNPTGRGRYSDETELLRRGGVTTTTGELTVGGVLALGTYPQQFFPRYVIQLASSPDPGATIRLLRRRRSTGRSRRCLQGSRVGPSHVHADDRERRRRDCA
jgi:ATP-dependent DNA helicase RecG